MKPVEPMFKYCNDVAYPFSQAYFTAPSTGGYQYRFRNPFGHENVNVVISEVFPLVNGQGVRAWVDSEKVVVWSRNLLDIDRVTLTIEQRPTIAGRE